MSEFESRVVDPFMKSSNPTHWWGLEDNNEPNETVNQSVANGQLVLMKEYGSIRPLQGMSLNDQQKDADELVGVATDQFISSK